MVRILAVLVLLAGCGSSSGGNPKAVADCNAFVTGSYCPKIAGCLDVTQDYCVAAVDSTMDCANVVGENGELATCEADIANSSCSDLVEPDDTIVLPPSCFDVFQR